MDHVQEVYDALTNGQEVKPLRLMLLGTAGTGKTRAVQTLLQEIQDFCRSIGWSLDFVKAAAPTGTASWNMRFNASTIHRLIHWFNPTFFSQITDQKRLHIFQGTLLHTKLVVLDEVSMIGRKMMARIDSRLEQATEGRNVTRESFGGMSMVCVGDPAQCEPIGDRSLIYNDLHKETVTKQSAQKVILSNRGLELYSQFDKVVILTSVHRVNVIENPKNS